MDHDRLDVGALEDVVERLYVLFGHRDSFRRVFSEVLLGEIGHEFVQAGNEDCNEWLKTLWKRKKVDREFVVEYDGVETKVNIKVDFSPVKTAKKRKKRTK